MIRCPPSPQALTGVGFAAQGWGGACGYKRLSASFEEPGKQFFKGIDGAIIGDFGIIMGGAVGDEIDRLDYELGTPPHALWLATSTGLSDYYQLVHEDILISMPGTTGGTETERVRADIVAFDIEGGGKVFSVGSINYAGAMATNDYSNNAAQLIDNALALFLNK
jgi:N,N-dimethylformamidase